MKRTELRKCVNNYLRLAQEIKDLEQQQDNITARIKRHLGATEIEHIDNITIRYTTFSTSRFDSKAPQDVDKETYNKCLKTTTSRRFSIN